MFRWLWLTTSCQLKLLFADRLAQQKSPISIHRAFVCIVPICFGRVTKTCSQKFAPIGAAGVYHKMIEFRKNQFKEICHSSLFGLQSTYTAVENIVNSYDTIKAIRVYIVDVNKFSWGMPRRGNFLAWNIFHKTLSNHMERIWKYISRFNSNTHNLHHFVTKLSYKPSKYIFIHLYYQSPALLSKIISRQNINLKFIL